MKYSALRNQVAALRALIPTGLTIRILGGLPPDAAAAKSPEPPGADLTAQAAAFRRSAPASSAVDVPVAPEPAASVSEPPGTARSARRA
jgi:hypothetical protein